MYLLDKPYDQRKVNEEFDMLQGNINRLCLADQPEEIIRNLGFAIDRLNMLAYSRIKKLNEY